MIAWILHTSYTRKSLELGVVVLDWDVDLREIVTLEDVERICREKWSLSKEYKNRGRALQMWDFARTMQVGDPVLVPRTLDATVAIGLVAGGMERHPAVAAGGRMVRPVRWSAETVPAHALPAAALAAMQEDRFLCRVVDRAAADELRHLLEQVQSPKTTLISVASSPTRDTHPAQRSLAAGNGRAVNLAQLAHEQVRELVASAYPGKSLALLLAEILEAQGYSVRALEARDEDSCDLVARKEGASLHVRVVKGRTGAGEDVRDLQMALEAEDGNSGMLVCWHGFQPDATVDAQKSPRVHLRDGDRVLATLFEQYPALPEGVRARIPLTQMWIPACDPHPQ